MDCDTLLSQLETLSVSSNIKLSDNKVIASRNINEGETIGGMCIIRWKIKYFWEVYPDDKTFTINNDIVLDVSSDNPILKFIEESPYYYNCKLHYDINYVSGELYNFKIIALKTIFNGDEIILKYDTSNI